MIIESRGTCACSSRTNGGKTHCTNHLRADVNIAEQALLAGIQKEPLTDDAIRYMQKTVRERLRAMEKPAADTKKLVAELHKVEARLERIADAIEDTGLTDTLRGRMAGLVQSKKELKASIEAAWQRKSWNVPDIIPGLVKRYRELVEGIANLCSDPAVTSLDVEKARGILRGLFGKIPVEPVGNVLVATVATTGAGLINSSPASINTRFVVAGACFALFLQCQSASN